MFFHYRQNNSAGWFDIKPDDGISVNVIIEARSAEWANQTALDIGLYFDGVDDDRDCECCGDRWTRAWGDGYKVPSMYGRPVHDPDFTIGSDWANGQPEGFVRYANGTLEAIWADEHLVAAERRSYFPEYTTRVTPWPYVEGQAIGEDLREIAA